MAGLLVTSLTTGVHAQIDGDGIDLDSRVTTDYHSLLGARDRPRAARRRDNRAPHRPQDQPRDEGLRERLLVRQGRGLTDGPPQWGELDFGGVTASIRSRTSEDVISEIMASSDAGAEYDSGYESGTIRIAGIGFTNTVWWNL